MLYLSVERLRTYPSFYDPYCIGMDNVPESVYISVFVVVLCPDPTPRERGSGDFMQKPRSSLRILNKVTPFRQEFQTANVTLLVGEKLCRVM